MSPNQPILIINYEYPPLGGGAATQTKYLAEGLAEQGCDVTVLTSSFGNLKQFEQTSDNLRIIRVHSFRKSEGQCSIIGMISFVFFAFWKLHSIQKYYKPVYCICFFGIPCGPLALWLKWIYKIPFILSLRGGDVPGFSPKETNLFHTILTPITRTIWGNASHIIANSTGLKELALSFYNKSDISVIHNGVDTRLFKQSENRKKCSKYKILTIGRLAVQKNIKVITEKIIPATAKKLTPDEVQFTIVGEGPLEETLKKRIEELQLSDYVEFLPWQKRENLPHIYNEHDILLHTSLYEGMSNTVMEAKACGLTIACYDIPGNRELCSENDYIARENDSTNLIYSLLKSVKHKNMTRGSEDFSISKLVQNYKKLLA